MPETWYLMEDGSVGDPNMIVTEPDGRLRHADGRAVAYGPHGPRSRGCVDAEVERAKVAAEAEAVRIDAEKKAKVELDKKPAAPAAKDMKPDEQKPGYKTRESKSE